MHGPLNVKIEEKIFSFNQRAGSSSLYRVQSDFVAHKFSIYLGSRDSFL
jgi:hypothetical protein